MVADAPTHRARISCVGFQKFLNRPNMVGESALHRWCNRESAMHANEVEKCHVKIHGGLEMAKAFAESQAQSSEAPQVSPNGQVGAFYVRCADTHFVWVSADNYWNGCRDFRRLIPVWPFSIAGAAQLKQLSEMNVRSEILFDSGNIAAQSVRRKLETSRNSLAQISNKFVGAYRIALGNEVGQNHFRVAVNRHPNVGIAPFGGRAGDQMTFFGMNEGPQLIGLHEAGMDSANTRIEKFAAVIANGQKERKNRSLMCASNPRDGAHTHALKQQIDDLRRSFGVRVVASKRLPARLRKRGITSGAAVTLDSLAPIESESLRFVMFASQAGHGLSPLVFLRKKPDNQILGFECGLRPLLNLASPLAETSGGASNLGVTGGSRTLNYQLSRPTFCQLNYGHHSGASAHHRCPKLFLGHCRNNFLRYLQGLGQSRIAQPIPASTVNAHRDNTSFIRKLVHHMVYARQLVARAFQAIHNLAASHFLVVPLFFLPEENQQNCLIDAVAFGGQRNNAAINLKNFFQRQVRQLKVGQLKISFKLIRGRLRGRRLLFARSIGNQLLESLKLRLHSFSGAFGFKFGISDFDFEFVGLHIHHPFQEDM